MQNYYFKEKNPLCCGNTKTISMCENPYCAEVCETGIIYRDAAQRKVSCGTTVNLSVIYNQAPNRYGGYYPDSGDYNYDKPSYGQVAPCTLQLQIESLPSQEFLNDCEDNEGFYKGYYQYNKWFFPLCKESKRLTAGGLQNAVAYLGFDDNDEFDYEDGSKRDVYLYLDLNMAWHYNQLTSQQFNQTLQQVWMPTYVSGVIYSPDIFQNIVRYGFNEEATSFSAAKYSTPIQNSYFTAIRKRTKVGDVTWAEYQEHPLVPSGYYNSNVYCTGWYNLEVDVYVTGIGLCNGQDAIFKITSINDYLSSQDDEIRHEDNSFYNSNNYACMTACLTDPVDSYVWPTGNSNFNSVNFIRSLLREPYKDLSRFIPDFAQSQYNWPYIACHNDYKNKIDLFEEDGITYKQFKKPAVIQVEITEVSGIQGCEHLNNVHKLTRSPKFHYHNAHDLDSMSRSTEETYQEVSRVNSKIYYTKRLENYDYSPSGYARVDCPECRYGLICASYIDTTTTNGASGLLWQNLCISELRLTDFDFPLNDLKGNIIFDILYDTYGSSPYRHHGNYYHNDPTQSFNLNYERASTTNTPYRVEDGIILPLPVLVQYSGQFEHGDVTEFGVLNRDITLTPVMVNNARLQNKINLYDAVVTLKADTYTNSQFTCLPKKVDLLCDGGKLPDYFMVNIPADMFSDGYTGTTVPISVGNLYPDPLVYVGYYDGGSNFKLSNSPFSWTNAFGGTEHAEPIYNECSGCHTAYNFKANAHCSQSINGSSHPEGDYLLHRSAYVPSTGTVSCIEETFCTHYDRDFEGYLYTNPDNPNNDFCHWKYLLLMLGKRLENNNSYPYGFDIGTRVNGNLNTPIANTGQVVIWFGVGYPVNIDSVPLQGHGYPEVVPPFISGNTTDCGESNTEMCRRMQWVPFSGHIPTRLFKGFHEWTHNGYSVIPSGDSNQFHYLTFTYGECDTSTTLYPVSGNLGADPGPVTGNGIFFGNAMVPELQCNQVLDSYNESARTFTYSRITGVQHSGNPHIDLTKNITVQGVYT